MATIFKAWFAVLVAYGLYAFGEYWQLRKKFKRNYGRTEKQLDFTVA